MSLPLDLDHRAQSRRTRVLAVRRLWRGLECRAAAIAAVPGVAMAVSTSELARELEELIAALDRRVPRVELAGEITIAREAAALRAKAVDRLAQLAEETVQDAPPTGPALVRRP
jgi:hypothetical protein